LTVIYTVEYGDHLEREKKHEYKQNTHNLDGLIAVIHGLGLLLNRPSAYTVTSFVN